MSMTSLTEYAVTAFYKFLPLDADRLPQLRDNMEEWGKANGLIGLLIFAREGCNGTVAGAPETISQFKSFLTELLKTPDIDFKDSVSKRRPFRRLAVQLRREAVTAGREGAVDEAQRRALSPEEWHSLLESGEDVLLIDTRNAYETEIGKFRGAIDPQIEKFTEFKEFIEQAGLPKDKKVLIYCTGGIRCEKAIVDVMNAGYQDVFQLSGGILKYLEKFPNAHYEGECFVFDNRVAVRQDLTPSETYHLCPHCGQPGKEKISCLRCGDEGIICARCAEQSKLTCSKDCNYQLNFQREKKARRERARAALQGA
jgi:UPF0176 protein